MRETTGERARSGAKSARAAVLPWIIYLFVLAVLGLAERLATPEGDRADLFLDVVLNLVAFVGIFIAGRWSIAAARQGYRSPNVVLVSILAGGFLGPLFAAIMLTAIVQDMDGGMWMMFAPLIGFLYVTVGLCVAAVINEKRQKRME